MSADHRWASTTFIVLTAACACGNAYEIDAGGADANDDAALGDAADDGSPFDLGVDAYVCRPTPPGSCSTMDECSAWGAAVAPLGTTVVTMCAIRPGDTLGNCTLGITSCRTTAFNTMCACAATLACDFEHICVSDTPGGPTRCARQCDGR